METRRLGSTDLAVPVIGMGTWQTYDVRQSSVVQSITDAALASGVRFFDSSPMYGAAERTLAETLGPRRSEAIVATKVWASTAREGRAQIQQALDWYQGHVDVYQVHNLVAWEAHLPLLEELRGAGRIRAIGITHYSASQFDRMARIMDSGRVQAIQVPYNPEEREVEKTLLPLAGELGLGVILMRPLGQGALVRRSPPRTDLAFLADYGLQTWAQALLNWGLSDPRVTVTIPATRRVEHAVDNGKVGGARRFEAATRSRVAALAARL
jgi:aryl-alcohol dehydrogenase-like predicted oxidoreductase